MYKISTPKRETAERELRAEMIRRASGKSTYEEIMTAFLFLLSVVAMSAFVIALGAVVGNV